MSPSQMKHRAECIRNWLRCQDPNELNQRLEIEASFFEIAAEIMIGEGCGADQGADQASA